MVFRILVSFLCELTVVSFLAQLSKADYPSIPFLDQELRIRRSQYNGRFHQTSASLDLPKESFSIFFFPDVSLYFALGKLFLAMLEADVRWVEPKLLEGNSL